LCETARGDYTASASKTVAVFDAPGGTKVCVSDWRGIFLGWSADGLSASNGWRGRADKLTALGS
jgi:hypothetical protein